MKSEYRHRTLDDLFVELKALQKTRGQHIEDLQKRSELAQSASRHAEHIVDQIDGLLAVTPMTLDQESLVADLGQRVDYAKDTAESIEQDLDDESILQPVKRVDLLDAIDEKLSNYRSSSLDLHKIELDLFKFFVTVNIAFIVAVAVTASTVFPQLESSRSLLPTFISLSLSLLASLVMCGYLFTQIIELTLDLETRVKQKRERKFKAIYERLLSKRTRRRIALFPYLLFLTFGFGGLIGGVYFYISLVIDRL